MGLSVREREILHKLVLGLTNKEIGVELCITGETVRTHLDNIMKKLDVRNRVQAAVWAVRNGF